MSIEWSSSSFETKLIDWKQHREYIIDLQVHEKLKHTALFFKNTPYGKRTIDYYSPDSWPDAWELMNTNSHCLSSISLMMYYTLKFVNVDVILLLINDGREVYLVPCVEDLNVILNYNFGSVSFLEDIDNITILEKFKI